MMGAWGRFAPCTMRNANLSNYLRACRKRAGLAQDEVAFLLGAHSAAQVSRYEHFARTPNLRTALALQVIFQLSIHDFLGGEFRKVEKIVRGRALRLADRLAARSSDPLTARKLALLDRIVSNAVARR